MRKDFTTGLAILLPVLLTCIIVGFLINILTRPFLATIQHLFNYFEFFQQPILFLSPSTLVTLASKIAILVFLMFFVILIGLLGKVFLIDLLFKIGDFFLHRVPVVNKIYKACQEVVRTIFSSSKSSFSQVVFVPFPTNNQLSIGLVTREPLKVKGPTTDEDWVPVFVPCSPNPTIGTMLMFKKEELIYTDMKVDVAMKWVVSCGVVMPSFIASNNPIDTPHPTNRT